MEQNQKHYYAFISHSTHDEKFALWLRNKLVNYNIPAAVRKEANVPKYLRPIFLYQTDLAANPVLEKALDTELHDSKFLIVICSPEGAQSSFVNDEVLRFINSGRANHIVPLIIDGVPYSANPEKECFPPALRQLAQEGTELRGIDFKRIQRLLGSRTAPVANVIATMLGVRFDVLWNIYTHKQRRRYLLATVIGLLICLLGLFVWDYNRPTYKYFADYVDKWGVPTGVIELTRDQQRHRHRMYQFEYSRIPFGEPNFYTWRVTAVRYVNSMGTPCDVNGDEYKDRYSVMFVEYNKQTGDAAKNIYCNSQEKVMLRHILSERNGNPACIADFIQAQENKGKGYGAANLNSYDEGSLDMNKSNIVRYVYERDSNGYIIRQTYHSNNDRNLLNSAIADADGIGGRKFELDTLGRPIRICYLDTKGSITCTKIGIAERKYEYDDYGNSSVTYLDLQNKPTLNENYWATCKIIADDWGNITVCQYLNAKGELTLTKEGYAIAKASYNNQGLKIYGCFCDCEGLPICSKDGYCQWRRKYDSRGYSTEAAVFNTEDKPCTHKDGFHKWIKKYDKHGNCIMGQNYGIDGSPCADKDNVSKYVFKYDSRNNCIEEAFYDENNRRCVNIGRVSIIRYTYNGSNEMTKKSVYDADDNPCYCKEGYSTKAYKYDELGNLIEECTYDTEGQLCVTSNGYAIIRIKQNDSGRPEEYSFYGADGKPCIDNEGIAKLSIKYDKRGNQTERSHYNIDNHLCQNKDGVAFHRMTYNDRGDCIEETFYNTDSTLCLYEGVAKMVNKYDERGNLIESSNYDTHGLPCTDLTTGFHKVARRFDSRGNCIEQIYYNDKNHIDYETNGVAINRMCYDQRDNMIESAFYDPQDKPCLSHEGEHMWCAVFDDRGNRIELTFLGIDKKPCLCSKGYAKEKDKYDMYDNNVEKSYWGVDGKMCFSNEKISRIIYTYNDKGQSIRKEFYNPDNNRCYSYEGISIMEIDDNYYNSDVISYDTSYHKCINSYGFCKLHTEYDGRGGVIERSFWGINDEPIVAMGYHCYKPTYDQRGHVISVQYLDADGNEIVKQVTTKMATSITQWAASKGLPEGSILIQYNDWKIGDSLAKLQELISKCEDRGKDVYYLTPDGTIMHLYKENGYIGVIHTDYNMDVTLAKEILERLANKTNIYEPK